MIEPTEAKLDNLHVGQKIEFTEVISESMVEKFANLNYFYWVLFLITGILLILLFYNGNPTDFIYFKF